MQAPEDHRIITTLADAEILLQQSRGNFNHYDLLFPEPGSHQHKVATFAGPVKVAVVPGMLQAKMQSCMARATKLAIGANVHAIVTMTEIQQCSISISTVTAEPVCDSCQAKLFDNLNLRLTWVPGQCPILGDMGPLYCCEQTLLICCHRLKLEKLSHACPFVNIIIDQCKNKCTPRTGAGNCLTVSHTKYQEGTSSSVNLHMQLAGAS